MGKKVAEGALPVGHRSTGFRLVRDYPRQPEQGDERRVGVHLDHRRQGGRRIDREPERCRDARAAPAVGERGPGAVGRVGRAARGPEEDGYQVLRGTLSSRVPHHQRRVDGHDRRGAEPWPEPAPSTSDC